MARKGKLKKFADQGAFEQRPIRFRKYKYLFLIVCEDEKTEPAYFAQFQNQIPPDTIFLKSVGTGRDSLGVVEKTIEERDALSKNARREVDVTWAVFDTDDANYHSGKAKRFQEALNIGKKTNINIAYSNEVFELWLLLHLTEVDHQTPLTRTEVYNLLQQHVRRHSAYQEFEYTHGDTAILEIVKNVGNQGKAFEQAQTLLYEHKNRAPINANPSTKVHLLIQDLLDWIQYFSYKPD